MRRSDSLRSLCPPPSQYNSINRPDGFPNSSGWEDSRELPHCSQVKKTTVRVVWARPCFLLGSFSLCQTAFYTVGLHRICVDGCAMMDSGCQSSGGWGVGGFPVNLQLHICAGNSNKVGDSKACAGKLAFPAAPSFSNQIKE